MKTFDWILLSFLIIVGLYLIIFDDDDDYSRVFGIVYIIIAELRILAYLNI